jgi:hypothetical protein
MDMQQVEKANIEQSGKSLDAGNSIESSSLCARDDSSIPRLSGSRLRAFAGRSAALAIALALGSYVGFQWSSPANAVNDAQPEWAKAATNSFNDTQNDIISLAEDVRRLNDSISSLAQGLAQDRARAASHEELVFETLERLSRSSETLIAEREDKNALQDARAGEPSSKESPVATPASEPMRSETSSSNDAISGEGLRMATALAVLAEPGPKPAPKNLSRITGWVLRDVYNGNALIESPQQVLHEVAPGKTLPGMGRVEAVKREGKAWMVVTSKGFITHDGTP